MTKALEPPPADFQEKPGVDGRGNFARAKPFQEGFPSQFRTWKKLGRPPSETPKVHIGFRLAADVVQGISRDGQRLTMPGSETGVAGGAGERAAMTKGFVRRRRAVIRSG